MLFEPPTSQYDLSFEFLGFRVRVAWSFWLVAVILGWGSAESVNSVLAPATQMDSPGAAALLIIWVAAVFLSILIHELGHSLAMRYYGTNSHIVLYHFGGLAVPNSFGAWNGGRQRQVGPREQIIISAAGPAAQLLLALVVWAIGVALDVPMFLFGRDLGGDTFPGSAAVYGLFNFVLYPSVLWAIINLAPILPLDGGQICKNALVLSQVRDPMRAAHITSVATGVIVGIFFLQTGMLMGAILFFMFAANNWQAMQMGSGGF